MTRRWIVWFIASTSFLRERLLWLSDVLCADAAPSILLVFLPRHAVGCSMAFRIGEMLHSLIPCLLILSNWLGSGG